MEVNDEDLRTLLVCSFRYALGRMTYMPGLVRDIIRKHADILEPWVFKQMDEDIGSASARKGLGADIDVRGWLMFRQWLRDGMRPMPRGARLCQACKGLESCAYCNSRGWLEASHPAQWPQDKDWTVNHEVEALLETIEPSFTEREDNTVENDRRSVRAAISRAFRIGQQRAQEPAQTEGFVGGVYRYEEETVWVPPKNIDEHTTAYVVVETEVLMRLFKTMTVTRDVFEEKFELLYAVQR